MTGKGLAHRRTVVMVPWQQVHRNGQRGQQPGQVLVLGAPSEVRQITGDDNRIGTLSKPADRGHRFLEVGRRVHPAIRQLARLPDVRVGELHQQRGHGVSSLQGISLDASRAIPTVSPSRNGVSRPVSATSAS